MRGRCSAFVCLTTLADESKVIPHSGHVAAHEAVISACIGHTYGVGVGVSGCAGTSFIPHFGHVAANEAATSGCIGQA